MKRQENKTKDKTFICIRCVFFSSKSLKCIKDYKNRMINFNGSEEKLAIHAHKTEWFVNQLTLATRVASEVGYIGKVKVSIAHHSHEAGFGFTESHGMAAPTAFHGTRSVVERRGVVHGYFGLHVVLGADALFFFGETLVQVHAFGMFFARLAVGVHLHVAQQFAHLSAAVSDDGNLEQAIF